MHIKYQSSRYDPALVSGHYVRCDGRAPNYRFMVFEAGHGTGSFKGLPGHGATLREYETDGAELPDELKAKCIASKCTEKWK